MPKISALTSLAQADVVTTTDVLPIVDATAPATTKKVTVQAMVNAGLATLTTLPSGIVNASLTSVGTLTALTVSGQASFAAGSAAAPSVRVGAEQNGLYSSAANTLDVALNGVRQAQFSYAAAAVNYATITGSATGNAVRYGVGGSDSNITWAASSKGTSSLAFYTNNFAQAQLEILHVAAAVNRLVAAGGATGVRPKVYVDGTDANIGMNFAVKGTGSYRFDDGAGVPNLLISAVPSAVNYPVLTSSATGNAVTISTNGNDTNIGVNHATKGNGVIRMETGGGEQFRVAHTANAVNYWQITGAATAGGVRLDATGSDSGVNAFMVTKGSGVWNFCTGGSAGNRQLQIEHTASAVNYLILTGAAAGNAVTISTAGSDTNRDIAITPGGAGVLRFGTHSAIAAETVTGYITIKDSAGNTRKLAVLS